MGVQIHYQVSNGIRWWSRMSRKRSIDKSIPISVALKDSLVRRLDQELDYTSSRSKYVAKAIENRLNEMQSSAVSEASTRQLMAALMARKDITNQLRLILETLVSN
jgi:predicted DNA-binding protein